MAQGLTQTALASGPEDLGLISGTHMGEREADSTGCPLTPMHTRW